MLVVTLSALGLVTATPASAATTLTGTGPGEVSTTLSAGLYQAEFSYQGNTVAGKPTVFVAVADDADEEVIEFLALDVQESHSTSKVLRIPSAMTLNITVEEAAADATWSLSFDAISGPSEAVSAVNFSGKGLNTSPLYRLKAGAYQATTTFAGNKYPVGLEDLQEFGMAIALYGAKGDDSMLVMSNEAKGTEIVTLKVAKEGIYWINPMFGPSDVSWSTKIVALKQFTSTPTPKISGTAKVGKTLKAKAGTWKPSGAKFSYQWYRGTSKISGATKSSYKLTSKDKGKKITVKVTGSKSGYLSVSKTSKSTSTVKK